MRLIVLNYWVPFVSGISWAAITLTAVLLLKLLIDERDKRARMAQAVEDALAGDCQCDDWDHYGDCQCDRCV